MVVRAADLVQAIGIDVKPGVQGIEDANLFPGLGCYGIGVDAVARNFDAAQCLRGRLRPVPGVGLQIAEVARSIIRPAVIGDQANAFPDIVRNLEIRVVDFVGVTDEDWWDLADGGAQSRDCRCDGIACEQTSNGRESKADAARVNGHFDEACVAV